MLFNTQDMKQKLIDEGFDNQYNRALKKLLEDRGYTQALPEALYAYLEDLGYEGQLSQKVDVWAQDNFLEVTPLYQFVLTVGTDGSNYGYNDVGIYGAVDPVEIVSGNNNRRFFVAGDDRLYFKPQDRIDNRNTITIEFTANGTKYSLPGGWATNIYLVGADDAVAGCNTDMAAELGNDITVRILE